MENIMEKIASFTIDHIKLQPGVYVSRKDHIGAEVITTFDLRMTSPNEEPVMNTAEVHTIEHLGATFLRNHPEYKDKTVYFGPMGCQTGFYFLFDGDKLTNSQAIALLQAVFARAAEYDGPMPGCSAAECGNYRNLSVEEGRACCAWYRDLIASWTEEKLKYPAK